MPTGVGSGVGATVGTGVGDVGGVEELDPHRAAVTTINAIPRAVFGPLDAFISASLLAALLSLADSAESEPQPATATEYRMTPALIRVWTH
jgi:hypothetical protein